MSDIIKKYGVFSAVGKQSLHRNWIYPIHNFDLHLIIYDKSAIDFKNDTPYITTGHGYKFKLIYKYILENPEFLEIYDYYYIPDDDILIDSSNISKLFDYMEKYNLKIAQPALYDSYYTFSHTIREKYSILRYTNFVELMQPCFSREALKKVIFTFNENESGWGIDYHWGEIICSKGYEMAIIDDVKSVHSRPVSSYNKQNKKELNEYLTKHKLNPEIKVFEAVPKESDVKTSSWELILSIEERRKAESCLERITNTQINNIHNIKSVGLCKGTLGISLFLFEYYRMSGKQKYLDLANCILEKSIGNLSVIKNDYSLSGGLAGVVWVIEYLAQQNFIVNNTDEVLDEIISLTNSLNVSNISDLSIQNGLLGYGLQLIKRIKNPFFNKKDSQKVNEINQLINILNLIEKIDDNDLSFETIADVLIFLNQLLSVNIQKDKTDRTICLYVNKLLNVFNSESQICLNDHIKDYLKSIASLYNIDLIKRNEAWKKTAIQFALKSINDNDFEIMDKDINISIEFALFHYYLYLQTHKENFKLFSVKVFNKCIEALLDKNGQYSFVSNHDKQESKSSITITGLMIISFLSENMPEWSQYVINEERLFEP